MIYLLVTNARRGLEMQGRPKATKEEKREKKVMLSFTEKEYEELKRLQFIMNKATLTATIMFFLNEGIEKVREEFISIRE